MRMLVPQVRDLVEEFLFCDKAFLVEPFGQRGDLPHAGGHNFTDRNPPHQFDSLIRS